MEYLLVMALSGSTMTCLYLLVRCLLRKKLCAETYYLLAKAAVLYYLIPLPFLKTWYREFINAVIPKTQTAMKQITLRWTNYVVREEEKLYLNIYAKVQITVIAVWLLVAFLLLLIAVWEYIQAIRRFVKYADRNITESQKAVIESLRKEYRIRRHIVVCQGQDGEATMTFGVFRPIIFCGRALDSHEAELLVRHEMVHIKRWDVLWKILIQFVKFLHWWNPIMWALYHDFEQISEWACDETAMQDRPEAEVKEYLRLMIEEARDPDKPKEAVLRWRAGFGYNAKILKGRMENLMSRKKWNRAAAGILVAVLAFANSMTVFAYRDVYQRELADDTSQETIETWLEDDSLMFVPDGMGPDETQDFEVFEEEILYDIQFTDEEGNIYPISEPVQRGCSHTFESGKITTHNKKSDGSCVVSKFYAQMCSKCSYTIQGDWISTNTYNPCPH